VADGEALPDEVTGATMTGHAIEARLYAEDPAEGFRPSTGVLHRFHIPEIPGVRTDAGYRDGSVVSPHYDAMLAKVIGYGRTRAEAARRLERALAGATLHGVTTNRDLLTGILRSPEFLAGDTDTGFLTRNDPVALSSVDSQTRQAHEIAAALARRAANRAAAPVLRTIPAGWRNVRSTPETEDADVHSATPEAVDMTVGGVRRLYRVHRVGGKVYVDGGGVSTTLAEEPRFPEPVDAAQAGSLLAPMPGTVVEVLAAAGDVVRAGQALLVLEAMKMRQTIAAPAAGAVTEIRVAVGDQVDTGAVLAVVEASDAG
jgi:acetyl/propionyl-CoA carboxylase alpha subunit